MNIENSEISISSAKSRSFSSNYLDFSKTLDGTYEWMPYTPSNNPLEEKISSEMYYYKTEGSKPSLQNVQLKILGTFLIYEVKLLFLVSFSRKMKRNSLLISKKCT